MSATAIVLCCVLFAPLGIALEWLVRCVRKPRCPRCRSRWYATQWDEWQGVELWDCMKCRKCWEIEP